MSILVVTLGQAHRHQFDRIDDPATNCRNNLSVWNRATGDPEISNGNSEPLYFKALERLVVNDREAAIMSLQESLKKDPRYSRFVIKDPDLQQLRDDERFQDLLGGCPLTSDTH